MIQFLLLLAPKSLRLGPWPGETAEFRLPLSANLPWFPAMLKEARALSWDNAWRGPPGGPN